MIIQHLANQQGYRRAVVEALFDFAEMLGKKPRPDLVFVSYERWPRQWQVARAEALNIVPNLVVKVVSLANPANEVVDKIADYFGVGVERAWIVYPPQQQICV